MVERKRRAIDLWLCAVDRHRKIRDARATQESMHKCCSSASRRLDGSHSQHAGPRAVGEQVAPVPSTSRRLLVCRLNVNLLATIPAGPCQPCRSYNELSQLSDPDWGATPNNRSLSGALLSALAVIA